MFILLGPDCSGKSTLASILADKLKVGSYYRFLKTTTYEEYLEELTNLSLLDQVCDRFIFCDLPYSVQLRYSKFQYTDKQFHNLILSTLAQRPLIILATNIPDEDVYNTYIREEEDHEPTLYRLLEDILQSYVFYLSVHKIPFIRYDFKKIKKAKEFDTYLDTLISLERNFRESINWWIPLYKEGIGYIGSPTPKYLLVAERLGPNNLNNLPFEAGPTGQMLTDLLVKTRTPLGEFAVTNIVKSHRLDTREPNERDLELFELELTELMPEKVIFMGAVAKSGIKIADKLKIEHIEIPHFGYYAHKGIVNVDAYKPGWNKMLGRGGAQMLEITK